MMLPTWFKPRGYKHFDLPVGSRFTSKVVRPDFVARHPFAPLIKYDKIKKSYDKSRNKTLSKSRAIMYASHRDACVLSYYSSLIDGLLDGFYRENGISDSVIAYRALGRGNYNFAADAYEFSKYNSPVTILAFDVEGFFDNLDHKILKNNLKYILGAGSLTPDWYNIFRNVTDYCYIELNELKGNPDIAQKLSDKNVRLVSNIRELKRLGIGFRKNPTSGRGIPQGTPISAALSNLYMINFDVNIKTYCDSVGAFYRRYSDDIMVVCRNGNVEEVCELVSKLISWQKLTISTKKTEITRFDVVATPRAAARPAQYLGFTLSEAGAGIRLSSLGRQWRRMRRAFKHTESVAKASIAAGAADRAYTKRLRRRFTPLQIRNFSSYARRSAVAFGSEQKILRQIRRFERAVQRKLAALRLLGPP